MAELFQMRNDIPPESVLLHLILGLGHYHGCWCPGSLRRQDISSQDID